MCVDIGGKAVSACADESAGRADNWHQIQTAEGEEEDWHFDDSGVKATIMTPRSPPVTSSVQ